uniref:MORN repeat-containing protein 5 n=1 Tax=Chromera velia CCMP2878 TaxID=1169474 RepID=A0A0G4IAT7_9ALVE|eukprot:Cvel_12663.t1-p1 / transcript=Cvel_12663.t1 / gene=Cvel_12663 / organism=Chromera_velia_CCMP2878 / gene_product=Radial spoke head 1 homolog, putative / transcript_product=Radial spoke head 1 homolog, putative / location=Cvel_scaffold837:8036-8995(-) / protein_length=320 / sequence_SO=supercontig / SO=protein_coding / is_pseudo=false
MAPKKDTTPEPPAEPEEPQAVIRSGKLELPLHVVYRGSFEEKGALRTCHGNGILEQGPDVLQGVFEKGQLSAGAYYFGDGSEYVGQFFNQKFHGEGTFRWADGKEYEGEWSNGLMEGPGTLTVDGRPYTGFFEKGTFDFSAATQARLKEEHKTKYGQRVASALATFIGDKLTQMETAGPDPSVFLLPAAPSAEDPPEKSAQTKALLDASTAVLSGAYMSDPASVRLDVLGALRKGLQGEEGAMQVQTNVPMEAAEAKGVKASRILMPQGKGSGQIAELSFTEGNTLVVFINLNTEDRRPERGIWRLVLLESDMPEDRKKK